MASEYWRGNHPGVAPSTRGKPICPWLLEVLSHSCPPAAPPGIRDTGMEPPSLPRD